jgi:hypothetical protein
MIAFIPGSAFAISEASIPPKDIATIKGSFSVIVCLSFRA